MINQITFKVQCFNEGDWYTLKLHIHSFDSAMEYADELEATCRYEDIRIVRVTEEIL